MLIMQHICTFSDGENDDGANDDEDRLEKRAKGKVSHEKYKILQAAIDCIYM